MRPVAVFVLVVSALVVLLGDFAEAAPVPPCVSGSAENLSIQPSGGVLHNGLIVQRSASDGLYRTDAGHVFGVERGSVRTTLPSPFPQCQVTATTLTVLTFDPFEGPDAGERMFAVEVQP